MPGANFIGRGEPNMFALHALRLSSLLLLVLFSVLGTTTARAAASEECKFNVRWGSSWTCFQTFAAAEHWLKHEPGTPDGHSYLVRDPSHEEIEDPDTNRAYYVLRYRVPPKRGDMQVPWVNMFSSDGSSSLCQCDAAGRPKCWGGEFPTCATNPAVCEHKYKCPRSVNMLPAMLEFMSAPGCPAQLVSVTSAPTEPLAYIGAPVPSLPPGTVLKPGSNTHAIFWYQSTGKKYQIVRGGVGCASYGKTYLEQPSAPIACPIGMSANTQTENFDEYCTSIVTGEIHAWELPAEEDCVDGNPCVPATGAKLQAPRAAISSAAPGVSLRYNSLVTSYEDDTLGDNWTGLLATRLLFDRSVPANNTHIQYQDVNGNREVFKGVAQDVWRPLNRPGKSMLVRKDEDGICIYTMHEADQRLVYSCLDGRLQRIEYPESPSRDLTVHYATSDLWDESQRQVAFKGTPQTLVEASGRRVELLYDLVNRGGDCSAAVSRAGCNALRLIAIVDANDQVTTFEYNEYGRLSLITHPDGTQEKYEYGNADDICPDSMPGVCDMVEGIPPSLPPYLLTGVYKVVRNPDGSTTNVRVGTYQYDHRGKVIVSTHPGEAGRVEVAYGTGFPLVKKFTDASHFHTKSVQMDRFVTFNRPNAATYSSGTSGGAAFAVYRNYDLSTGYVVSHTDERGVQTRFEVGPFGLLTRRVEAANDTTGKLRTIETDWDHVHRVPTERRTFDSSGALKSRASAKYEDGRIVARCFYDTTSTSAMQYVCGNSNNAPAGVRQVRAERCTQEGVTDGSCPVVGLLLKVDGARSGVADEVRFTYRQLDHSSCATDPAGCPYRRGDLHEVLKVVSSKVTLRTTYLSYDGAGRPLSISDANGVVTDFLYNERGWLTKVATHGPSDEVLSMQYDGEGHLTRFSRADGAFLAFTYDDSGRMVEVRDSLSGSIRFTLDRAGNTVLQQTRTGTVLKQQMQRAYDDLGRLSSMITAYGHATTISYADNGDLDTSKDPLNRVIDVDFDPLRRLVLTRANRDASATDKASAGLEYDALDRLVRVIDPKGLATAYDYDGLGNLSRLTSPDTGTTVFTYNESGQRASKNDARPDVGALTYIYDPVGRLLEERAPTEPATTFEYDSNANCATGEQYGLGRLAKMSDASGSTLYCYDAFGNVVRKTQSVTGGSSLQVGSTYSGSGHLTAMTYPSGAIVTYLRNANGQINRIDVKPTATANQVTLVSNVNYMPFGPRQAITFGNGRLMQMAYDLDYGIDAQNDGVPLDGLYENYTLNAVGELTTVTESTNVTRNFTYDGLSRLTAVKKVDGSIAESYTYDASGDRLSKTVENPNSPGIYTTTSNTYAPGSHMLTKVGSQIRSYDAAGNTKSFGTATTTTLAFAYNERNRLAEVSQGVPIRQHLYNGKGERVAKWFPQATGNNLQFVYDEAGHLLGEYNSSGFRVAEYVWMDDTLVGVLRNHDGTTYQYVESDHLNTPRIVVNPLTNKTIWRWELVKSGFGDHAAITDPDNNGIVYNLSIRFPGQYYDGLANINYNYYRDYDSTVGRYIESDPVGLLGGLNTYGYAYQRPTTVSDRDGRTPVLCAAVGGLVGGLVGGAWNYYEGGSFWTGFGQGGITGLVGSGLACSGVPLPIASATGSVAGQFAAESFGWKKRKCDYVKDYAINAITAGGTGLLGGALPKGNFTNKGAAILDDILKGLVGGGASETGNVAGGELSGLAGSFGLPGMPVKDENCDCEPGAPKTDSSQ
jgi:RHS repeat-associated protein